MGVRRLDLYYSDDTLRTHVTRYDFPCLRGPESGLLLDRRLCDFQIPIAQTFLAQGQVSPDFHFKMRSRLSIPLFSQLAQTLSYFLHRLVVFEGLFDLGSHLKHIIRRGRVHHLELGINR